MEHTSWNSNATVIFLDNLSTLGSLIPGLRCFLLSPLVRNMHNFLEIVLRSVPLNTSIRVEHHRWGYAGHYILFCLWILSHKDRNFNLSAWSEMASLTRLTQYLTITDNGCGEKSGEPSVLPSECSARNSLEFGLDRVKLCLSVWSCVPATIVITWLTNTYRQKRFDIRKGLWRWLNLCYSTLNIDIRKPGSKLSVVDHYGKSCNFDIRQKFPRGGWNAPHRRGCLLNQTYPLRYICRR